MNIPATPVTPKKEKVILYVGRLLSYDHILNAVKRHTTHLARAQQIDPERTASKRMDHADLIIYESKSLQSVSYPMRLETRSITHADGMSQKAIKTLLLSRVDEMNYQVWIVIIGYLLNVGSIGSIRYCFDSAETASVLGEGPFERYFTSMDWKDFEQKFVIPALES